MKGSILLLLLSLLMLPGTLLAAAPVVLFDEGHGQPFLAKGDRPLDLSSLAQIFAANGYEVRTSSQHLDADQLADVKVLVTSGAFQPYLPEEVVAIKTFVEHGGGLAIMLHIASPLADLGHAFNVDYTNYTLREKSHLIGDNPLNFRVRDLRTHPLTAGLQDFAVYGAWALRSATPAAEIIAQTSAHGWVDLNQDGQLSIGDAVQPFGVVVAGTFGMGHFVVFGDDALFQNRYLEGTNRLLAENLVRWLLASRPQ